MSLAMFVLFPLFIRALGGDELVIGLVLGVGLGASVAVRPFVGALLDRVGRRAVLLWAAASNAASWPLFLVLDGTGPALYLLAGFHLMAGGALFAAYFTYAADLVPAPRRAEGIAIFGVAGMAPNGLGPALGEVLIARGGYPAFFGVACAFALASLALTLLVPSRPSRALGAGTPPAPDLRALLEPGLLRVIAATLFFGAGINAAFYFLPPFTRDLGVARAAPFFAAYAATTIVLRITGRRALDRFGPHRASIPAFALFAAGLGGLCLLPAAGTLVLAGVACGAGHGTLFPVLGALAVTRTPPRLHGTVMSLYTGALDMGAVVGTPLCGAVARGAGYRWMFALMAAASLAGLVLMAADRGRDRVPPAEPL
jgi:MFS family permease